MDVLQHAKPLVEVLVQAVVQKIVLVAVKQLVVVVKVGARAHVLIPVPVLE